MINIHNKFAKYNQIAHKLLTNCYLKDFGEAQKMHQNLLSECKVN